MAITKEKPTSRNDEVIVEEEDQLYEPITEAPKPTKRETLLQRKREKAGLGLMQLAAFGAGMLGRFKLAPVLPEDIAAVHYHARPIAKALADCATEDERFAAVFDRLTDLGPYGAIIEAVTPLVVQVIANHKTEIRNDPALARQMGVLPPDVLMRTVIGSEDEDDYDARMANVNGDGASQ
jgi:hypothetical protein